MRYTREELDAAALHDLRVDMEVAERQAVDGPFYPDRGITPDSLRAYADECRRMIERYKDGGAHAAVVKGRE